jgi:hypothetical protein
VGGTNRIVFIVKVAYGQRINCFGLNKSLAFFGTPIERESLRMNNLFIFWVVFGSPRPSDSKSVWLFSAQTLLVEG